MSAESSLNGVVVANGLGQRYRHRRALTDVTLTVPPGVTVLLGPNGAGKTTLLETIATLRKPADGSLMVLGLDATRSRDVRDIRRRTGFLPQDFGYFPHFTLVEFVEYCAWLKAVPDREIPAAASTAIGRVGLADRAGSPMRTLSGGMLRRAGIAQAIVHDPTLVIMDEPTVGLDPAQRMEFRRLVRELAVSRHVLISTHLVDDVKIIGDHVIVLESGGVAFSGSPAELESIGTDDSPGDTRIERGYSASLHRAGSVVGG
jgi:ABC-2 type transport system ATP-binding protein